MGLHASVCCFFFFQAEDGIRDLVRSRGLGDVYKRQSMENLIRSVADLQRRLEEAGVPSVVIGGLAVSAWGEPRLTRDADLKVLARRDERGRILELMADFTTLHADPAEAF